MVVNKFLKILKGMKGHPLHTRFPAASGLYFKYVQEADVRSHKILVRALRNASFTGGTHQRQGAHGIIEDVSSVIGEWKAHLKRRETRCEMAQGATQPCLRSALLLEALPYVTHYRNRSPEGQGETVPE